MTVVKFNGPRVRVRYCTNCGWGTDALLVQVDRYADRPCPNCEKVKLCDFAPILEKDHV